MDFAKYFTAITYRRKPSVLREFAKRFAQVENGISLANGMPNTQTFPFKEIAVTYHNGTQVKLAGEELDTSLQYGPSQGYIPLLNKMREFQKHWHKPAYNDWDILMTAGSMDGCSKVFEMILEVGDPIMVQTPTYDGILKGMCPFAPEYVEIPQDKDGIDPEYIVNACEERLRSGKKMPKLIYVNPTGANPTGTILTETRRRKIYELAEKYDFLILEDDAYVFIKFVDKSVPSFLELDNKGQVIRLDTFSKIFSAGLRLGVVTAHKEIIKRLTIHMESTTIHSAALSQMLLYKFLTTFDQKQLKQHFEEVRRFYLERRNIMMSLLEKHLSGLAEWNVPQGGMFVWMKVNKIEDVTRLATERCVSQKVFLIPGHAFNYDQTKPSQYLRLSYSYSSPEQIDKALSILAQMIREEQSA